MSLGDASSIRKARWPELCAVGAISFCLQLPFFDRWFSHVDEGHVLLFADLINKGGQLYRDASMYPLPGAFYMLAWIYEIFGTSNLVARWVVLLEFTAFSMIAFALLRRAVRPSVAWLGYALLLLYKIWCFPHWHQYSYSTTAQMFLGGSLLAILISMERGRWQWLAGAGLLAGIGCACKQDYGGATIIGLSALLAFARVPDGGVQGVVRRLACFLIPAAAVGAWVGGYYLSQGTLGLLLHHTVSGHLVGMEVFDYPSLPPLFPLFEQTEALRHPDAIFTNAPGLLNTVVLDTFREHDLYKNGVLWDLSLKAFYYGPYVIFALSVFALWRQRNAVVEPLVRYARVTVFAVSGAFLAVISLNRPQDFIHVAVLYWPTLFMALYLLDRLLERMSRPWPVLLAVSAAVALAAIPSASLFWKLHTQHSVRLDIERGGIYVRPHEAPMLESLVEYVQERVPPDGRVNAMPYFPLGLFLADRIGSHRATYVMWPMSETPERGKAVGASMDAMGVDTVIWNFTQFPNFPPVWEYAPDLYRYLADHFEIDRVFSDARWGYLIGGLKRSEPRGPSRTLYRGPQDAAGVWIETLEGQRWDAPPDQWKDLVKIELWPFRDAITIRPSANGGRTVLSIRSGRRPLGTYLETAIGVHPDHWPEYPASFVKFQVRIATREGERTVVFEQKLDPNRDLEDRGWVDVRIPLDAFPRGYIEVELATEIERVEAEQLGWAAWEVPRLTVGSGR